ncbi:MAG TPA: hybrid sensor histidine kinase/response regulator [Holophagaceae bacterium]|nr:hybrid sensor histidine kinase/response regulator [Holophagaceae bacterium]
MVAPADAPTILVIDDDPDQLSLIADMLEASGFQVRTAPGGVPGLAAAREVPPGLILLDITMPGLDGFEVCRALKVEPALGDVPVIFTSGRGEVVDKEKAFALGGVDYLQRPFRLEELLLRVRHQFGLAALQAQLREKNESLQWALQESKILNRELVKINDRLRVSEELHGHFLATMRSVINNPLTAIIGLAEQIHQGQVSLAQGRTLAGLISGEAFYLDFQLRNIFAAADLEAGTCVPRMSRVDVGSILANLAGTFAQTAEARAIRMRLPEGTVEGALTFGTDADMLRTILANLLANAIAFSHEGGEIRIGATLRDGALQVDVADDGIGIREADQALIFDRFHIVQHATTSDHQGPGLGLAIARALMDLLGGKIEVASAPGQGARFTCTFPEFAVMDEANTSSFEGNMFIFDAPKEF